LAKFGAHCAFTPATSVPQRTSACGDNLRNNGFSLYFTERRHIKSLSTSLAFPICYQHGFPPVELASSDFLIEGSFNPLQYNGTSVLSAVFRNGSSKSRMIE